MRISVILFLTIILYSLNLFAQDENKEEVAKGTCGTNCHWVIEDNTLKITGAEDGTIGHMDPCDEVVDGVYQLKQPWRSYQSKFDKVDISGVDNVVKAAFRFSSNVKEVAISDSVKKIDMHAFAGTRIKSIVLPDSVSGIGLQAFNTCEGLGSSCKESLEEIIIPDSVESIGDTAFGDDEDVLQKLKIICKGEQSKCDNILSQYKYHVKQSKYNKFPLAEYTEAANAENCGSTNFYWNGDACLREPDKTKQKCCKSCQQRGGICRRLIYTVDEANTVAGKVNSVKIRYR